MSRQDQDRAILEVFHFIVNNDFQVAICKRYALALARAAYKTTISTRSLTVLIHCRLCIIFSLRGRFPLIFKQICVHFTYFYTITSIQANLLSFTLIVESRLISFPEATKIFQFAFVYYLISLRVYMYTSQYITFLMSLFNTQLLTGILNSLFVYLFILYINTLLYQVHYIILLLNLCIGLLRFERNQFPTQMRCLTYPALIRYYKN